MRKRTAAVRCQHLFAQLPIMLTFLDTCNLYMPQCGCEWGVGFRGGGNRGSIGSGHRKLCRIAAAAAAPTTAVGFQSTAVRQCRQSGCVDEEPPQPPVVAGDAAAAVVAAAMLVVGCHPCETTAC